MDKRQKRSQIKMDVIKKIASELFATYGVEKVTMDEIAEKANVSKVTIYKYFGSKDELYAEVVAMYVDETLAETEAVFNSDIDFLEKLKYGLTQSANTSPLVSWSYLQSVWDNNGQLGANMGVTVQEKVKSLMRQLIDEGKATGYIDKNISFELIYLYSEIFRAGLKAKAIDLEAALLDEDRVEDLLNLYYFGFIQR